MKKNLIFMLLMVLVVPSVYARVGDSRRDLEQRLVASGYGRTYPTELLERRVREAPYARFLDRLQGKGTWVVYYKTDRDSPHIMSSVIREALYPTGWDLHVYYVNETSAIECYRRNGPPLSDFEMNILLALNQGDSFWKRVPRNEAEPSAFGYEFERDDGLYRARRVGNYMLFFRTNIGEVIAKQLEEERLAREAEQEKMAPSTTVGF
jgi:hypothetical protein